MVEIQPHTIVLEITVIIKIADFNFVHVRVQHVFLNVCVFLCVCLFVCVQASMNEWIE